MTILNYTIDVRTKNRFDFVDITPAVQNVLSESEVGEGFVLLRCPHTTAALLCNEKDRDVKSDFSTIFNKLVPKGEDYKHTMEGVDNARAHQLAMLLGDSLWVPIEKGSLVLGTWQNLFFVELLEPRSRKVEVIVCGK